MDWRIAVSAAATLVILAACRDAPTPVGALPPFPEIRAESFPAEARERIQQRLAAAQAAPHSAQAVGELAILLHAREQLETAALLYERASALEPGALRWRYYAGVVQAQIGATDKAAASLEAALDVDPEFIPARRRLGAVWLDLNRLDAAAESYRALLERNPDDAEARFGLGRTLALRGETAQAIEEFSEAVRLAPDYGAAHYELSLAYRDAGQPEPAQRHLELYQQRKGAPRGPDPLMAAVEMLAQGAGDSIRRGIALEEQGDLTGAIQAHLRALEVDADVVQAHVNLVSLYGRTGEPDKAAEHYQRAAALNPGQADLHYNYGVLLFGQERFQEARQAFEKAVESNPAYAEAHNNLGQVLELQGRLDQATTHYQAAIQAQPQFRLARFHLGRMLLAQQHPQQAAEQFQRAIEPRDEMTPQVLFGLAAAQAQIGDRAQALRLGQEARALAAQMGQHELARRIERDLAKLR